MLGVPISKVAPAKLQVSVERHDGDHNSTSNKAYRGTSYLKYVSSFLTARGGEGKGRRGG